MRLEHMLPHYEQHLRQMQQRVGGREWPPPRRFRRHEEPQVDLGAVLEQLHLTDQEQEDGEHFDEPRMEGVLLEDERFLRSVIWRGNLLPS